MTLRIGRWDCDACGYKGNLGPLTACEKCGSSRPANVKFYLTDDAEIVTDKTDIEKAKMGADWVCSFCTGHNKVYDTICVNCGNDRDKTDGDHSLQTRNIYNSENKTTTTAVKPVKKTNLKGGCAKIIVSVLGLLIISFIVLELLKKEVSVTIIGHLYETNIAYEQYKLVEESDWSLPTNATLLKKSREIHHYNKVSDGYETKTRTVQVKVGERQVKTGVKDLGNGYYEDIYESESIYEDKTETYQEEKFKEVPVYETKYTYEIYRWVAQMPLTSAGSGINITYHPNFNLIVSDSNFKITKTQITHFIQIKDAENEITKHEVSEPFWTKYSDGTSIKAERSAFGDYSEFEKLNK